MGKRTRQSNTREYCPLCARALRVRAAAVSHYEAHVRAGLLEARGERGEGRERMYLIPEARRTSIFECEWWARGFSVHSGDLPGAEDETERQRVLEQMRIQYHVRLGRKALGLKV